MFACAPEGLPIGLQVSLTQFSECCTKSMNAPRAISKKFVTLRRITDQDVAKFKEDGDTIENLPAKVLFHLKAGAGGQKCRVVACRNSKTRRVVPIPASTAIKGGFEHVDVAMPSFQRGRTPTAQAWQWDNRRTNCAASELHRPSTSMASTTSRHRRAQQLSVGAFLRPPCGALPSVVAGWAGMAVTRNPS